MAAMTPSDYKRAMRKPVVYFVVCTVTKRIKVGHTERLDDRLAVIQAMSPTMLELRATISGGRREELEVHTRFADEHSHGEWFHGGGLLSAYIESLERVHRPIKINRFRKAAVKKVCRLCGSTEHTKQSKCPSRTDPYWLVKWKTGTLTG